jgi:similar to spore coat protein
MNGQLTDKEIALDMLSSSKATVTSLAKTLTEATNPQIRETLRNQLTACLNSHYRLSDISITKGWFNAYAEPEQQLKQDLTTVNEVTQ